MEPEFSLLDDYLRIREEEHQRWKAEGQREALIGLAAIIRSIGHPVTVQPQHMVLAESSDLLMTRDVDGSVTYALREEART